MTMLTAVNYIRGRVRCAIADASGYVSPKVLEAIALAEITKWALNQSTEIDSARVLEVMRAATEWVYKEVKA